MPPRPPKSRTGPVALGLFTFFALVLGGGWLWLDRSEPPPPPPVPENIPTPRVAPPEPAPLPRRPVLRYEAEDDRFRELMDRRKAEVGLDESVDMIVREDENIRIGDHTLSMSEILDAIRLERGDVLEEDLDAPARIRARRAARLERLHERLRAAEQELWSLEQALVDPTTDPAMIPDKARRREALDGTVADFQRYKETLGEIDAIRELLETEDPAAAAEERIAALAAERKDAERRLRPALEALGESPPPGEADAFAEAAARIERRFREIEKTLAAVPASPESPESSESPEPRDGAALRELAAERARLRDAVAAIRRYGALGDRIAELESLPEGESAPEALRERMAALADRRDRLEGRLMADVLSDEPAPLFGIHVVRPGNNIWNIHFRFLREYFGARDIRIAPGSDRPDERGVSSGVGRILKFSETMVYIYNLRERRMETNLDLIHPRSKIVVFNLSEAFDLLGRIDAENIRGLRFDGETLWIPAG
jgi:hypothetical protein